MNLPILYKKLLQYLKQNVEYDRIDTNEFYRTLSYFRIDRQTAWQLLKELEAMGIAEYKRPNKLKFKRLIGVSLFNPEQTYTYRVMAWLGGYVLGG